MMPQTPWAPTPAERMKYRSIFDNALKAYEEKTGNVLSSVPLLRKIEKCHAPDDIITILRQQIPGIESIDRSRSSHSSLTSWLNPTVDVINSFSAATDAAIDLLVAHTPTGLIFTAIGVLLSTDINSARGSLLELFERIENVFRQLETYLNIPMNAAIMDVVVEVLTEVLCILAIATKEINQNRAKMFLKKLVGRKDIEDAIQRLEKVTSEEARMAAAEALNSLHGVGDKVMGFDHRDGIQSTPKALEVAINVVTESLQGADVRAKDTRNKAINGVEEQGRQTSTDFYAVAAGDSKAVYGVSDRDRAEQLQSAWSRAKISDGISTMRGFVARTVDDVENMSTSTESNSAYLSWGLSNSSTTEWFSPSLGDSSMILRYPSRLLSSPSTTEWLSARDSSIISRFEDSRDFDSQTLSHYASNTQLITQQGVDINSRDSQGRTALHRAIIEYYPLVDDDKELNIIELLLDHGADVGVQDTMLFTPLHLAAGKGKYAVVQLLLRRGASVHARDTNSSTPLHHASWHGHPNAIQLLLGHGADTEAQNNEAYAPLHLAAWQGRVAAMQKLLEHGARIDVRDKLSWTPLHHASWHGHPDIIQSLLEHGADIETQNYNNSTPLHLAAQRGEVAATQNLLGYGARVDAGDRFFFTPLYRATWHEHPDVIQLLLDAGKKKGSYLYTSSLYEL